MESMSKFTDIDTPISEAELAGLDASAEDANALKAIAGDDSANNDDAGQGAAADKAGAELEGKQGAADEKPPADNKQEADADDAPAQRDAQIPRGRFDEVNSKLRAERERAERLEAELEALRSGKPAQPDTKQDAKPAEADKPAFDYGAKEREYIQALTNGDDDAAIAIRAEINAQIRREAKDDAERGVTESMTARQAKDALNSAAAKVVKDYPALNENGGDNEQAREVVEWRDFYIAKGQPAHEALLRAAERVCGAAAKPTTPPPPADPRKAAALARNAADANAQPAAPAGGIGNRGVPNSPIIESQSDWDRLPQAERERLLM